MELASWAEGLEVLQGVERQPHLTYRHIWRTTAGMIAHGGTRPEVSVAGHSVRGEPLWAIAVPPAGGEAAAGSVFVMAGIHAMEHIGIATALAVLERALGADSPWRRHRVIVMPMVNPDGFVDVERMLAAGGRRFVRKNARGVDLNRNFAVSWDDRYYLSRLLRGVFSPGDGPLSEPETQAVDRVLSASRPTYAVSLHAFGEWIFLPYAGSREAPPELARMQALAAAMVRAQPHRRYRVAQLARRSRLFRACGAEIDHFYGAYGAMSFLVEIGAGPRLGRPFTWLDPYSWFNPPDDLFARDVANVVPAIEALATAEPGDAETGNGHGPAVSNPDA